MSIRSIGGRALAFSSAPPAMDGQVERRTGAGEPSVLAQLTFADRELIAAMFGPDVLATGHDAEGNAVGVVPDFVALLLGDRISGRLPVGVEVTSMYLQGIWDHYTTYAGPRSVVTPLTRRNLTDGLHFLGRRAQGGTVDVRA